MKKIIITIFITLIIGVLIGANLKQTKVVEKEIQVGGGSIDIKGACNCPEDVIFQVGCTDQIEAENVEVLNVDKIKIDGEKYKVDKIKTEVKPEISIKDTDTLISTELEQ